MVQCHQYLSFHISICWETFRHVRAKQTSAIPTELFSKYKQRLPFSILFRVRTACCCFRHFQIKSHTSQNEKTKETMIYLPILLGETFSSLPPERSQGLYRSFIQHVLPQPRIMNCCMQVHSHKSLALRRWGVQTCPPLGT